MEPFVPKNEVAEWKLLLPLFENANVGDVITYEQMSEALDRDFLKDRGPFYAMLVHLQAEHSRTAENVRATGYRIAHAADHERLGKAKHKSAHRSLKKAHRTFASADRGMLTPEQAARMDALEVSSANHARMLKRLDSRTSKHEEQIQQVVGDQTDLAAKVADLTAKFNEFLGADK